MNRSNLQRALSILGVLLIASSFVGLGIWQLNRARESRIPVVVDSALVSLDSVTQPRIALPSKATLRHVQFQGTYISDFQAPFQMDGAGQTDTWEVGLLATQSDGAILVVRGLWSERNLHPIAVNDVVEVTGKLLPHQNDDVTQSSKTVLSRLDSALVVAQTSRNLYDGYVIADAETVNGQRLVRARIAPPTPRSAIPGFYWQHLSYVVIWWFMAGVVLYLPFYQRRVAPNEI
jgi:cytochrome oxidase assembly protein ShyY1